MSVSVILDTDTLSLLQRGHKEVVHHAEIYILEHGRLAFTELTWYEIVRGYRAINAYRQLEAFREFCSYCLILPLDRKALNAAADIYVNLRRRGELIGEIDILIAGIALANGFGVVTRNTRHFKRIEGLHVENWTVC
ncbi:TPA: type II toxin-antitoxin system VapC family toxin [Candidatus Poribacteria bacterium]|nr:type II toxin-antitoxin system VapC family toxin [Candidatus Poribacteria bacterium]HEX28631.1 type II toxin-antitoxin system VapC family toxin [Candidatus Poribacteria bacterium]